MKSAELETHVQLCFLADIVFERLYHSVTWTGGNIPLCKIDLTELLIVRNKTSRLAHTSEGIRKANKTKFRDFSVC